jgi:hypothetical protein
MNIHHPFPFVWSAVEKPIEQCRPPLLDFARSERSWGESL